MLWTNYGARGLNEKIKKGSKKKINLGWATFWGVFPDLFAFTIPFLMIIPQIVNGVFPARGHSDLGLASTLYQYSHSIVIWAIVFTIVWIIFKRPRLELLGWALHILIDIPSHAATFYSTPFLFPISDYKFTHGVSWANPTYMIINYSLLIVVFLYIFYKYRKSKKLIEELPPIHK